MRAKSLAIFFLLLAVSCSQVDTGGIPSTAPNSLVPYRTFTPYAPPTSNSSYATTTPAFPTPTPIVYTIVIGDTLGSIASRFGVKLEDLLAANPGVNPNAMSVGTTLIIPSGPQDIQAANPSPTPVALSVEQLQCYPDVNAGLWCFALVSNPLYESLENIIGQIILVDADNQVIASQFAMLPLDILQPGVSMPLAAYFSSPVPDGSQVRVQITSATRLLPSDTRYLPAAAQNILVSVDWSGRSAQVTGGVILSGTVAASQVWVAGVAYDASGRVVGIRRWESAVAVNPGESLPFSFIISSLGAPISRVDVYVEVRP